MRTRFVGLLSVWMCGVLCASAMDYHVAMQGADSNPGTAESPFRTIHHAAELMKTGDTCFIHAGVYRETVHPANAGEAGKPIVFRAFANDTVVVSGADPVEGWQPAGDGKYSAPVDWEFEQLFIDGAMMHEARWPNAESGSVWPVWAEAESGSGIRGIVDPDLPDFDPQGTLIHVLPGHLWVSWMRPVTGLDTVDGKRKALFEGSWSQDKAYEIRKGTQYYLFRSASLLDTPGEWYLDRGAKTVRLIPPEGKLEGHRVEAKRRELAFDLRGCSNVNVEGLHIIAATIHLGDAQECTVSRCHIRFPSHFTNPDGWGVPDSGIIVSGLSNTIRECSIQYSAGNGVTLGGENNTVSNCLVRYVDYMATDCGAVFASGRHNIIERNTLCEAGRSILLHRTLKTGRIEYNNIFHAGLLTTDLGSTYCYSTDGEGTIIAYNWVHDNMAKHVGVGIYIDNGSSNFTIHHNVSWNNPDSGIRLNTPSNNNLVYNNTVLDSGNSLSYWGPNGEKRQPGCRAINNIFTDEVEPGDGIELANNYQGKEPGIISKDAQDFQLKEGSPCIDAGQPIEGITGAHAGAAPDIGAYEYGQPAWKPGHDWGEPPVP
ncbi:MAG: right-handed parallel beta-helix repeat-containing protein [Candidatus Hydrogenedentes bacterium]|nr:right-handed parallel beta-helix repeat-containing protein [Candidatus Hydrogenedentota bacterium]